MTTLRYVICAALVAMATLLPDGAAEAKKAVRRKAERETTAPAEAVPEPAAKPAEAPATEKPKASAPSGANINKYNCEELYGKCMNRTCFDTKEKSRCKCHKDAALYKEAGESCGYIPEACPAVGADIIRTYARAMAADCTTVALADNGRDAGKSLYNKLAELTTCMKPKCRIGRSSDAEFVACFDSDNLEAAMRECKDLYPEGEDQTTLRDMFYKSIADYKAKYCEEINGEMQDGECIITIGIGLSPLAIKEKREFKVGDKVVCSQAGFAVKLESGALAIEKKRAKKNLVLAGIRLGAKILGAAGKVLESARASTKDSDEKDGIITRNLADSGKKLEFDVDWSDMMGTSLNMAGEAVNVIPAIMTLQMEDDSAEGRAKCYAIKGGKARVDENAKPLLTEDDEVYYILRWTPDWTNFVEIDDI